MSKINNHIFSLSQKSPNRTRYKRPFDSEHSSSDEIHFLPISFFESNVDVLIDDNLDISAKKILVLSLVRNVSQSANYLKNFIDNLIGIFGEKIKFCFVTNNNIDSTIDTLRNIANQYSKNIQVIVLQNEKINTINRIEVLAKYRNLNFYCGIKFFGTDFDNVIVFDSDLYDDIPIQNLINSLKVVSPDWSCISGNHCYDKSRYYYDELALRFLDDPIDIKKKFSKFNEYYGHSEHWLNNLFIFNYWTKVRSAFGGISIYRMKELLEIYNKYGILYDIKNLPEFSAEHIGLNLKLQNNILINPDIRYTNSINIEGKMYHRPIAFVPRDAGFFSVFNFYIGCLSLGVRAYPYFNKQALLSMNGNKNEHFCYWTQNDNCWFDYFEPVKFFDNDDAHLTDTYKSFMKHRGEIAPTEFRIPRDTHSLIKDTERFNRWRHDIHSFYSQYIKYNSEILDKVNNFWNTNINNSYKTIGVHYRHPSHFIESGKVYLEQYFDKIDIILKENPNTQIFLATDSNFGLYAFKEKYGNKIKYINDVERLSMTEFLHWCFSLADGKADDVGFINGTGYELHHKRVKEPDNRKLTIDLLTEVLCLSKCDYLVHTTSNVALAISYMNPNLELVSL